MDGNKDESERCINLALKCLSAGHKEKARKFLTKAQKLYPSKRAKSLLESLDNTSENCDQGADRDENNLRQRSNSNSNSNSNKAKNDEPPDYTPEQLSAVKRINNCKDVYEVLEVSRDFPESDLKKAYRKLALQMHPDKNKAPGATEAFKAVGKAYSILSDKEKRRQYDLYGPELQPNRASQQEEYSHGFDGDISPEELFNMFFGGSFPSSAAQRHRHHQHSHGRRTYYTFREPQQSENGMTLFFQLAPIILLVALSMLSSFFVSDPIYSLQRNDKYHVHRATPNLKVSYYVKEDFKIEFKSDLRRIERAVEEEYIGKLRNNCLRERNIKENMLWQARNYGDKRSYERATDMKTPSCDTLQNVYS